MPRTARVVTTHGVPLCAIADHPGAIVASAIHAGHALRPGLAAMMALPRADRLREEDPHTERFIPDGVASIVAQRSRFEVDLNRPRERAVYLGPEDAWGLEVWSETPDAPVLAASLEAYDAFYAAARALLDDAASRGSFAVLDLHSYNHRRGGPNAAADDSGSPEVNLGTGSLDRDRWGVLADAFASTMAERGFGVGENVRFRGGRFAAWVNSVYAGKGCALAIEFKKTFMDEWTGAVDEAAVTRVRTALAATVPVLERVLSEARS